MDSRCSCGHFEKRLTSVGLFVQKNALKAAKNRKSLRWGRGVGVNSKKKEMNKKYWKGGKKNKTCGAILCHLRSLFLASQNALEMMLSVSQ